MIERGQLRPDPKCEAAEEIREEIREKHLIILDQISNIDDIVNNLDRLIQRISPSDEKMAEDDKKIGYDHISLHEFLLKTPDSIYHKINSINKRLEIINQLLF